MDLQDKVKAAVAKELTNFLLSSQSIPQKIEIVVKYAESSGRITIDAEKIAKEIQAYQ